MELKEIYSSFVKAQLQFAPALKTSLNPHFKSKYADLAACVEAVIDALNQNGIGLTQKTHHDERGVTVETTFIHISGQSFSGGVLHVPAAKQDPQGYGSALSYARRYSLMTACGIAPEDDDGNAATKPRAKAEAAPLPASFKSSPTMGVMAGLPPDRQAVMVDYAEQIKERMQSDDVVGAYELASEVHDSEEKTALWSLLPSNARSAIKKHAESLKAAA